MDGGRQAGGVLSVWGSGMVFGRACVCARAHARSWHRKQAFFALDGMSYLASRDMVYSRPLCHAHKSEHSVSHILGSTSMFTLE